MVGLVGAQSERFRRVTMSEADLAAITILDAEMAFNGDGNLLRLGIQAYSLGIAYEFDPYFGLSISRVDPLPHQLEAVYDYLLKLARVRFLLADDAGAGKTIMAGLLIKELKLRGMCERILIVAPANLAFQWQRELKEKFDEKFFVIKGDDIRDQFGVNQWLEQKQLITSLDLAKRTEILPGLRQVHWDLIIVDEAHRMSWSPPARKTARYALGELLRDISDHMLLLTATPHKGDPANFSLFLQLLDVDAYADVKSIREAMDRRRAPFYLRRTKEAMVYFPERQPDNTWVAKKIFTKRIPHTVDFHIDGAEFDLYKSVTRFVKRQSARAAAAGDDPRARAVGFLMALYQRRLASSTRSVCCSLENRARRLDVGLKKAQEIARTAPPDLPDADELEEMEEGDRERLEHILEAISLAGNAEDVRTEIAELKQLAVQAVERITSILVLPHPDRASPEVRRLRPNPVTEATAMRVVMEHERAQGRQVFDVSEKNLGYDITSVDLASGDLRLIEVKGIGDTDGSVLLSPNERRVAEDRRDCYWLYVVTHCNTTPQLREPIRDPARLEWVKVTKVAHYRIDTQRLRLGIAYHRLDPQPLRQERENTHSDHLSPIRHATRARVRSFLRRGR